MLVSYSIAFYAYSYNLYVTNLYMNRDTPIIV